MFSHSLSIDCPFSKHNFIFFGNLPISLTIFSEIYVSSYNLSISNKSSSSRSFILFLISVKIFCNFNFNSSLFLLIFSNTAFNSLIDPSIFLDNSSKSLICFFKSKFFSSFISSISHTSQSLCRAFSLDFIFEIQSLQHNLLCFLQ